MFLSELQLSRFSSVCYNRTIKEKITGGYDHAEKSHFTWL